MGRTGKWVSELGVPRAGARLEMQAIGFSVSHLPSPDAPSRQGVGAFVQPAEASASTFRFPSPANSEVPGSHLPTTQRVRRTPVPGAKSPPQEPGPGSLHSAVGLKGCRVRSSCLGTGRPTPHQGRRPFLPLGYPGGHQTSRRSYGQRTQNQLFLLTTAEGRSPQRPQGEESSE